MSTDKLEKPKHPSTPPQQEQQSKNYTSSNTHLHQTNSTLPRNFSRIKVHDKGGGGGLKRNASMSDVSHFNYSAGFNGIRGTPLQSSNSSSSLHFSTRPNQENRNLNQLQVPPHIVKSIVISVLEKQGVPNPSDDIINRAIEEYYNKNPQGVSLLV